MLSNKTVMFMLVILSASLLAMTLLNGCGDDLNDSITTFTARSITVDQSSATLVPGDEFELRAHAFDQNGDEMIYATFNWVSSDPNVVTVVGETDGTPVAGSGAVLTAVAVGNATITISVDPDYQGAAPVTVNVSVVPGMVTNVAVDTDPTLDYVDVSWDAVPSTVDITYDVFRSTVEGETGTAVATGLTETSYRDVVPETGVDYYYSVQATGNGATGDMSDAAAASAVGAIPADWFDSFYEEHEAWDNAYGPDPLLGAAHGSNDPYVRTVYGTGTYDDGYPVGTVIVKRLTDINTGEMPEVAGAITAMRKRSDGYYPDNGNWEWFMRAEDGSYMSGGNLGDGMCNNCHAGAGESYVFDHSSGVEEFFASNLDFAGYDSWTKIDYTVYPTAFAELGGFAHSPDSNHVRGVYTNEVEGLGQLVVKEVFSWDADNNKVVNGITAMAKRGGDFNASNSNWEWFFLDATDGTIMQRMGEEAGCNGCHAAAPNDYIFDHPAEYVVDDPMAMFEDAHTHLPLWASNIGTDPFLQGAHGDSTEYQRDIYKWQPAALPEDGAYPIGTIIVKRLTHPDTGDMPDSPGAITAMVKRGDDFNSENGNWEWFMRGADGTYVRGGAEMGCNGCHANATGENGTDYVFTQPGE
ncbi:MAG: hypothetical protein D6675_16065 [Gemmatimonadetes bacterium]|nr:MAG: hypothetical protein D6675_16065 [Gemmatimonadota bacterium]